MIIKNKQKSFTLIELLVVIVIIGILAGVIMISTSSSIDKANFAKAQAFSSTVQNELLLNLVSEWTFDEPEENGKTKDTWGNNHGTVVGATQVADCVFGGCYSFDGSNDYIEIADSREMRMTQGGTITAWIYPKSRGNGSGRIIDKGSASGGLGGYFLGLVADNKIAFRVNSENSYSQSSADSITYNKWQFITITFNELERKIYIDGMDLTAIKGSLELPPNIVNIVRIGSSVYSLVNSFDGYIDDVRIYNIALSSSEIKQNYIAGLNSMLANGNISRKDYNERINNLAYNDNNE